LLTAIGAGAIGLPANPNTHLVDDNSPSKGTMQYERSAAINNSTLAWRPIAETSKMATPFSADVEHYDPEYS